MIPEQRKSVPLFRLILMMLSVGMAYFFSNFHRFSLGVISADIAAEFALDPVRLGLMGSAFFYSYAFMQIASGFLTDKAGSRLIITLSCILTAAATLWFSAAGGFAGLFFSRILTGFAVAFVYVPALAVIREWFDKKIFATMTGVLVAIGQFGGVCTSVPLQFAANNLGWRDTFRAIAYVSIALCILVWFTVRSKKGPGNSPGTGAQNEKAQRPPVWESSKEALKKGGYWSVPVFLFITGGTRLAFQGLWGARYYDSLFPRGDEKAVLLMTISVGCIIGAVLLGFLADRLGPVRVLASSGFLIALVWFLMAYSGSSANIIVLHVLGFMLGLLGTGGYTITFSVVRFYSSQSNGGFLTGINGCLGFLGTAIFTQLIGVFFVSAGGQLKFHMMFLVFSAICVLSTLWMMLANRNVER